MIDLTGIDTGAALYVSGEAWHEAPELDYFNGTGIAGGYNAEIYGLLIEINGKEYTIPAAVLSPDLLQHLKERAETELNEYY